MIFFGAAALTDVTRNANGEGRGVAACLPDGEASRAAMLVARPPFSKTFDPRLTACDVEAEGRTRLELTDADVWRLPAASSDRRPTTSLQ